MEQILERLTNNSYFFLDGYSGYSQIAIQPEDQEKTTFTCPYCTYAYKLMPFGLCNAAATFQECVLIFLTILLKRQRRFLWMILLFMVLHFKIVFTILTKFCSDVSKQTSSSTGSAANLW